MTSKYDQHTLLTFLVCITFIHFPATLSSETECPYPCSPSPPTGSESTGTLSPPLPTGASYYPPPPPGGLLSNLPSPPPTDHSSSVTLPAPDTVVPWYPYYSKRPTHDTHQSSLTSLAAPTVLIGSTILFVFLFFSSTFAHTLL